MSQHDGVIDNGPGLAVRTDMNAAVQALMTLNSGPVEPTTKYPGQLWLDTTVAPDGLLRQRNQANNGWIAPQTGVPANVISNIVQTVLTSSGTYTKPAGLKFLEVTLVGGGGGGSRGGTTAAGQAAAGAGGGGGGAVFKLYAAADLAATEAYTIGAGGTSPGGGGGAGGSSTFKGLTASGGTGGGAPMAATATTGVATPVSNGGTASGGDVNIRGGWSAAGWANPHNRIGTAMGGEGGGSFFALARPTALTGTSGAGIDGESPGGGGAGGAMGASQSTPTAGSLGGAGAIILKEYF